MSVGLGGMWTQQNRRLTSTLANTIKEGQFYRFTFSRRGRTYSMYVDGKLHQQKSSGTYTVPSGAAWVLGQEQDSKYGGFQVRQGARGKGLGARGMRQGARGKGARGKGTSTLCLAEQLVCWVKNKMPNTVRILVRENLNFKGFEKKKRWIHHSFLHRGPKKAVEHDSDIHFDLT